MGAVIAKGSTKERALAGCVRLSVEDGLALTVVVQLPLYLSTDLPS